jgi:hypothetical protein
MSEILSITMRIRGAKRMPVYKNEIKNPYDATLLLLVFKDLEGMGIPIRKTCLRFLEGKDNIFPF